MSGRWFASLSLLGKVSLVAASLLALAAVSWTIPRVQAWRHERDCRAAGGVWGGLSCLHAQKACNHDGRQLPLGVVFADGCNTCECQPFKTACTNAYCLKKADADEPLCRERIFDPGCDTPRAYCGRSSGFQQRDYCACDGTTFTASAPKQPYRHLGHCP